MNILIAHDGSKHGKWAMEWSSQLRLTSPPAVMILHVVDAASLRAPFMAQPVVWANEAASAVHGIDQWLEYGRALRELEQSLSGRLADLRPLKDGDSRGTIRGRYLAAGRELKPLAERLSSSADRLMDAIVAG